MWILLVLEVLAGKIECLQITNFMCHSNLEIKFNSMINFITGRNGSGKSAIMTALIVVLGGTATITGRGSGLSGFNHVLFTFLNLNFKSFLQYTQSSFKF